MNTKQIIFIFLYLFVSLSLKAQDYSIKRQISANIYASSDIPYSWMTYYIDATYVIDDNDGYSLVDKGLLALYDGYVYGGKNSYRMRNYHRLDIGFNFVKQKKWGERTWNLSIYNVYSRQNPYYYDWDVSKEYSLGKSTDGSLKLYQISLFPFMPSVSYSFKF